MSLMNRKPRLLRMGLPILLLSIVVLLMACTQAPVTGWSGPTVSQTSLYVGTIEGKVLALDISESRPSVEWEESLESSSGGGALACGARLSTPMSTYGTPAVESGKVLVGGFDGLVYSIDVEDQAVKTFDTGSSIVGSPVVAGETIFIGNSDGSFYALDLQLNARWTFETGDKIWATAAVSDGIVYIGSSDHYLYALDVETGDEIWSFETGGAVLSTPLVVDETVYVGSNDNKFYAIDAATGSETWAFESGSWFWTQGLWYDGEIWVGSLDRKVYSLDAESGESIWELETEGMVQSPPVLIQESIFVGSEDGNIYSIDPVDKSSRILVSIDEPVLAPIYADQENGILYVHAQNGTHTLYAIEVDTGETLWSYETSGG